MSDEAEDLEHIRANAALAVEQLGAASGLAHFGYDAPSVEWLDGFIERQRVREDVGPEFVEKLVSVLGSYLGECIIRSYGGRWALSDHGWGIEFDEKNAAFPFAKVRKQFANGKEDGVYSFFTAIPLVFRSLRFADPPDVPPPRPRAAGGWLPRIWNWFGRRPSG